MLWRSVEILLEFDPEPFTLAVSLVDMPLPVTQINGGLVDVGEALKDGTDLAHDHIMHQQGLLVRQRRSESGKNWRYSRLRDLIDAAQKSGARGLGVQGGSDCQWHNGNRC